MLVINGIDDPIIYINGSCNFDTRPHDSHPPASYGVRYFREKYNCDPNNTKVVYYKENENDKEDFTRCTVSVQDENNPNCKTPVQFCVANKGGHMWWSTWIPIKISEFWSGEKFGGLTSTINLDEYIFDFFG